MAQFFINRPVFAWVLSIIIMLAGVLSISALPIEQYPKVAPPIITINASYPGASAKTVENAVTQIIEQRLTGIDNLCYFSSSNADGSMTITLTFEPEADPDIAQVQTQNKIQGAITRLPQSVQALGVTVTKASTNFLLVVALYSDDGELSQSDVGDIAVNTFRDPLSRIDGVGDINIFGNQHSMRIWLDPAKLYSYTLTPLDVQRAIQVQNTDISAGQLGGMPAGAGQQINATLCFMSQLKGSLKATLTSQLTAQHQLVETAQNVYDLSEARYHAGIDNFLSVLDAERELYNAQQTEILLQREGLANMVNLYKALGGGQILPHYQPIGG